MSENEYKYMLYLCYEGLKNLEAQAETPTLYFSEYIKQEEKVAQCYNNMENRDNM